MAEVQKGGTPVTKFKFITSTSTYNPTREDRKQIKSHVSRGRPRRQQRQGAKSWILQRDGQLTNLENDGTPIPGRVGSDLSLVNFPEDLKPYMQEDFTQSIKFMKGALYPPEICLQVDPMQSSWTTSLLIDLVYFHSALFSIEAYLDAYLKRDQSSLTQFHFLKTVRLLQERLNTPSDPNSVSDPTIMVVITLGLTAELIGDRSAAQSHAEGLARMVELRGGLEKLNSDNPRLPAKVCRVDIGLALRFGTTPVFFKDDIPWDPYIAGQNSLKLRDSTDAAYSTSHFIASLDYRLVNVWLDLQEFSRLANLAAQTSYKLPPNTFSEIMISILYRLFKLSFPESHAEEAMRIGMMTYAASIFFRWRTMRQRQAYLDSIFRSALQKLEHSSSHMPLPMIYWLLVLWHVCTSENPATDCFGSWLDQIMLQLGLRDWTQARQALKGIMWVDCMYDSAAVKVFDETLARKDTAD